MKLLARVKPLGGNTKTFAVVVLGQLISTFGTRMAGFGMGVWVYQETGSKTQFALTLLLQVLPTLFTSFFAGLIVDQWDRRRVLILSDVGGALGTALVAIFAFTGQLQIWHIYLAILLNATFNSIHFPAFNATIPLLVPKKHLGRANGIVSTGNSIGQIFGPALAGVILVTLQLGGLLAVDFLTFLVAVSMLLMVRIPNPEPAEETPADQKPSLFKRALYGLTYVRAQTGLLALFIFQLTQMFLVQMSAVVFMPMILDFSTADVLGLIVSIGGAGGVAGGLVMSTWGGPKRRIYGVLGGALLIGLGLILVGIRPFVPLVAAGTAFLLFLTPIQEGSRLALWQSKVTPNVQGRVFALLQIGRSMVIVAAYSISGLLTDRVFDPLFMPDGALAGTLGTIIGVGPGRGAAFFYVCLGLLLVLVTVLAYFYPRLRLLEDEVPDAT